MYEGSNKDAAIESVKAGLAEVMIVTHSTFKNNPEKSNDLERFLQIQWKLTIIDEFHVFKVRAKSNMRFDASLPSFASLPALCLTSLHTLY